MYSLHINAQDRRGYTVIYGGSADYLKFSGDTSMPQTGHYFPFVPIKIFGNATSNICDSVTGGLRMLCNGYILYDTVGNIIENGDTLVNTKLYNSNCCPSSGIYTQGSIILPKGSNNQYYLFNVSVTDSMFTYWNTNPFGDGRFPFDILQYHVVDMNANAGMGKLIQKKKIILENQELNITGMMACKHANGYDWWLLKQGANANTVYTFLVTKDTVLLDTIQTFQTPIFGYYGIAGQSSFNSDGSKYAFASGGYLSDGAHLFIADFDRCYGVLSNVKEIKVPYDSTHTILDTLWQCMDSLITGVCFSPNDSFLYISRRYNMYQYDLHEADSILAMYLIPQIPPVVGDVEKGHLQLGIDGRIYIGKLSGSGSYNSLIHKPNNKGMACNFCKVCLYCDSCDFTMSLSNMPNFNMPKKEPCYPLANGEIQKDIEELDIYPNPSSTVCIIKNKQGKKKELYNVLGELLFSTKEDEIDVRHLAKGMYYLRCENEVKKVIIE